MKIVTSTICKQGGREFNQDYVATSVSGSDACLVVCDGLGSYIGSEVASRLCAQKVVDSYEQALKLDYERAFTTEFTQNYIQAAHNVVSFYKEKNSSIKSSCTTVACVVTNCNSTVLCHIGDTRIYFFKNGLLNFQSKDHSLSQLAVESGKICLRDVRNHIDQNKLTRVLGGEYFTPPDSETFNSPLAVGDAFIICSDGFWEYIYEEEMALDLKNSETPLQAMDKMEKRLLARISRFNDNYSAIIAMVTE